MNPAVQAMSRYKLAGVDEEAASAGLLRVTDRLRSTWPTADEPNQVLLPFGYFANVVEIGGTGIAICTDGVGSKALIAQMIGRYDTIGIDCVAMNVNDLICVGATPVSMVDYLAVEDATPDFFDEIAMGLNQGARMAGVSISGGEFAQLGDMIKGEREGSGFDLAGTAIGHVGLENIIVGQEIENGDVVIGLESNGVHSNGLTLARRIFFDYNNYHINSKFSDLDCTLGEELIKPTYIYVREVLDILSREIRVKALIHVTSDGFLNLARVKSNVGFVIDKLPTMYPIFYLIMKIGNVPMREMFSLFNMGIGFCIVVPQDDAARVLSIVESHGRRAKIIGHADQGEPGIVSIPQFGLKGNIRQKEFFDVGL